MRPGSILSLDKIKLYYPFFRGKNGKTSSLIMEAEWLIAYLILCDVIVIPPREFLYQNNLNGNFNLVDRNRLLQHLFQTGQIVTASPRTAIRDFADLFEYYHPNLMTPKTRIDFVIYDRDEYYQRRVYTDYLIQHVNDAKYYGEGEKISLVQFLSLRPNHPDVLAKIDELSRDMEPGCVERLGIEAMDSYFLAGAKGNGAIMPPSRFNEKSIIYNPFYGKTALHPFKANLEKVLRGNLLFCSPDIFDVVRQNLLVFRHKYYQLSQKHQDLFDKIQNLLSSSYFLVNLPLVAIFAATAVAVASALSPMLSMSCIKETVGAGVMLAYFWKFLDKEFKIADRLARAIIALLEHAGVLSACRRDVIDILDEFKYSTASILEM